MDFGLAAFTAVRNDKIIQNLTTIVNFFQPNVNASLILLRANRHPSPAAQRSLWRQSVPSTRRVVMGANPCTCMRACSIQSHSARNCAAPSSAPMRCSPTAAIPLSAPSRGRRLPHQGGERGADLRVADFAGALDGRLRVRHLHLWLDLGALDRRHGRSGIGLGGSALYSRIHRAKTLHTAARLLERQPLAGPAVRHHCWCRRRVGGETTDVAYRSLDRRTALSVVRIAAVVWRLVGAKRDRALVQLGQSRVVAGLRAAADSAVGVDGPHLHAGLPHGCGHRDARRRGRADQRRPRPGGRPQPQARGRGRGWSSLLCGADLACGVGADFPG